eukprot:3426497-Pleurochrysis_carterae.AAC.1
MRASSLELHAKCCRTALSHVCSHLRCLRAQRHVRPGRARALRSTDAQSTDRDRTSTTLRIDATLLTRTRTFQGAVMLRLLS